MTAIAQDGKHTSRIILLCKSIDEIAMKLYLAFARHARAEMGEIWRRMADEELTHIKLWRELEPFAKKGALPQVFDDPDKTAQELEKTLESSKELLTSAELEFNEQTSVLGTLRMEFFLVHPAFEVMFHIAKTQSLEHNNIDYQAHIESLKTLVAATKTSSAEYAFIDEIIDQSWENNRKLARHLVKSYYLTRLIPICASCKKIRNDKDEWLQLERFFKENADADFTHSICPECASELLTAG